MPFVACFLFLPVSATVTVVAAVIAGTLTLDGVQKGPLIVILLKMLHLSPFDIRGIKNATLGTAGV